VSRELLELASSRLDPDDLPILGMIMDRTDRGEIASVLQITPEELEARIVRMLGALRIEVPGVAA
jgi:hypothetical protein